MPMRPRLHALIAALASIIPATAGAIVGGTIPDATEKRFDCVCGFGSPGGVPWGAGTLIAPDKVLIAAHLVRATDEGARGEPGVRNFAVKFRRSPNEAVGSLADPSGFYSVDVARIDFITPLSNGAMSGPGWVDAAIVTLAQPVAHITPAELSFSLLPEYSDARSAGTAGPLRLTLAGWGNSQVNATDCNVTYGRGELRTYDVDAMYASESIVMWPSACATGMGPVMHDSGAGVFAHTCEGRVLLVGLVSTTMNGPTANTIKNAPRGWMLDDASSGVAKVDYTGDRELRNEDYLIFQDAYQDGLDYGVLCADVTDDGFVDAADMDEFLATADDLGVSFGEPACPCDVTGDGQVLQTDWFEYVNDFFGPRTLSDMNDDGVVNDQDFFDFVNCYFACPNE